MKAKTKLFLYKSLDKALIAAPWIAFGVSVFTTKGTGSVGAKALKALGGKALRKSAFNMLSVDTLAKKVRSDFIHPKIEGLMKTQLLEQAEEKTRELRTKP
jgi:hypothetical protein